MREISIVLGLLEQGDNYLLQLREGSPEIGAVNMIGCFGGKIEPGESAVQAVQREICEETTLASELSDWEHVGSVDVVSDHQLEQVKVSGSVFKILLENSVVIEAREGKLVTLPKVDIPNQMDKMTPGTRAVFEQYIGGPYARTT